MNLRQIIIAGVILILSLSGTRALAQLPIGGRFGNIGSGAGGGKDSLQHRKEDTITINFRYLDSSKLYQLDSSILDLGRKLPLRSSWINLGNNGTAARPLVFTPRMQSGWDPGWHAYDLYTFTVDETKMFHTTKPYTELGFFLATRGEQNIDVFHTRNIRPNWNYSFQYRLINAPGTFQNQNTNHNNYRFTSWYQSRNKRYQNFFILTASVLGSSENGGLQNPKDLDSIQYSNQATLPVQLGQNLVQPSGNFFSSKISTGTKYSTATFLMRQQYDLGQKDSIVTDSSVIPLFYPRLRLEHTMAYSTYHYRFFDLAQPPSYALDSAYYADKLGLARIQAVTDSIWRQDNWRNFSNDFSFYTFPDAKNPQQFLKLGATLELLTGNFDTTTKGDLITAHKLNTQNVFAHGEYRNRTRNQKWDIEANGRLYLNGLDAGDYNAYISLKRLISRQVGYFQAGFENANRTPGFVFDRASSFNNDTASQHSGFNKENTTHLFASLERPQHHLLLSASYYLMTNYSYFHDYYKEAQAPVFNILQVSVRKQFTLYRHWKWRTNTTIQQVAGSSPVHVPLIVSINQVGYDGNFGLKNLVLSFGTELRYISPYKADGYSPGVGQFFSQNSTVSQKLPDLTLYLHMRIRSFTAYLRGENVNAIAFAPHGFGFYNNNFVAPNYPSPGLIIRFGFYWGFIN
ncbi:putative porin [Puia sp.]|uniref:putative porin n=1 Tax=Puia sp. TaxID=2045100 RepID=UPI002F3EC633